jgi:ATP-dependent helicase/nuclease subunit A
MGASPPEWTPAQLRGIRTTGKSLLVSAAAGSGKTAMLAARCAYLVCEAPEPCDVDELLVVTFTESAAAQMKSRIHSALRDRAAAADSERLRRQVAMVDHASVSTLHSFCARILREHFHAIGLDPAFTVMDGDEASLLRREIARELFDDRYELDAAGDFQRFIDAYGEGDDARLIRRVIHTHELLASLVDPDAWLARSRERIRRACDGPLEESELGAELVQNLSRAVAELRARCDRAIELVGGLREFPKYIEALSGWSGVLRFWDETLANDGIDALAEEVAELELPRLPAVSNSVPGKELAKSAVDAVRDAMTKGSLRDLLRFTAGQWQEGLRATRPHAEVFLSLVEEFGKRYRAAKDASRVVDFTDLERLALQVLSDGPRADARPSPAARSYHDRFKHVLVDEYQDINEVQDAILALLSRECADDDPGVIGNLFCVGDVKQSIYRFRLAEAARFLARQKRFRDQPDRGELIDLQSNFRSRGPLLEAINAVFERLMSESAVDITYDDSHRLRPGLVYPAQNGDPCFVGAPIEMHLLPAELAGESEELVEGSDDDDELDRSEREAVLVAQRIRQLTGLDGAPPVCVAEKDGSGQLMTRPIRFGDIVILLRSIRYKSGQYAEVLRRAGIPVHAQSGTGYFDSTEIRDMLALLSVLDNQRQDIPLATVLRSPLASLAKPEDAFARVRMAFPSTGEMAVPFHDAVVRYVIEKDDALAGQLKGFLAQLDAWRQLAHRRPLAELIHTIYGQSGYLAFCAGLHDGEQRVANLMDLHERASHFGSFHRQGLSRFMQFLGGLRDEMDLGQPSIASEADNVVRVMSVHRSKGLEFPVVFLPDLGKRINFSDCQGTILVDRSAGLGMAVVDEERMIRYPSLASVLVQQRLRQQALAEELRVLYVAMTRAREHLVLVGTCDAKQPECWSSKWAGHGGPFPDDMVLGARCLLDWLGPVAAAASGAGDEIVRTTSHSAAEVASWQASHGRRPTLSARQSALADLRPIEPAPVQNVEAQQAIDRLTYQYPFAPFAALGAAEAVTSRAAIREGQAPAESRTVPGSAGASPSQSGPARELARPRFLAEQVVSPIDVGTATHLVLMHLDFASREIDPQIALMVERRLITAAQAGAVDCGAIEWLLESELGTLLRSNAKRLRRELPIHFPATGLGLPESQDPYDRVMVRGRIDVLVPDAAGLALIDYKTDNIAAEAVPARARTYASQLEQYRTAIERMTQASVRASHLVFLKPRVIFSA